MADNTTLPGTGDVIASDDVGGVKYQRVKPVWGVDGVAVDVEANNPLPTSVNASIFRFSTNNSTSAELASNATFTGVLETALDQPSISLLMTSDQPMTLTIFQYIDIAGVYAVTPIVYTVAASQGFSASFALNGNYVKVTAKNTGTATTTTFELNTAYGSLPASDGSGRLPTSQADCVPLLSQILSAAGVSTTINSAGYGSIVAQLSGVWQGMGYFETSNLGTTGTWSTTFVMATDSTSMQDVVTGDGVYTIIPGGIYLRFVLTSITGTAVLTAIGRSSVGVDPSAMLTLAMDKQNNTPLNVQLLGTKQDAQGALVFSDCAGPYYASGSVGASTIGLLTLDTIGYSSLTVSGSVGAATIQVYMSDDNKNWCQVYPAQYISAYVTAANTLSFSSGSPVIGQYPCVGRYAQIRFSAVSVAPAVAIVYLRTLQTPQQVGFSTASGALVVSTTGATTTTPSTPTASIISSAATTNATSVKASAGTIYMVECANSGAAAAFVKLHNSAAAPTVGTTAVSHIITVPASGTARFDGGVLGMRYGTGIALSITNLITDTDATAVALNQVKVNISYV